MNTGDETHRVQLTHRLTLQKDNGKSCSVALCAVQTEDEKHIFYVGLYFVQNNLKSTEDMAELAKLCEDPITIDRNSYTIEL